MTTSARVPPLPHPFMPSSASDVQAALLEAIGVASLEELYSAVPASHRWDPSAAAHTKLHGRVLDDTPKSERQVERLIGDRLRSDARARRLCFRGGGCAPHYVPAVCHEIAGRREFLTVFAGSAHTNRGVFQAQFEFQSLMAELLEMEVVGATCYDWGWAAAKGVRLGLTVTGRPRALVVAHTAPARLDEMRVLCGARHIEALALEQPSGRIALATLEARLARGDIGALYLEMPSYLGGIDPAVPAALALARRAGAISVLGVDPICLGLVAPPGALGADIACGSLQGLGIPMYAGGGEAGFLACREDDALIAAFPDLLVGAVETDDPAAGAYFWVNFEETQYGLREQAADFTGTTQSIWSIVAAAYLALAGRRGLTAVGEANVARRAVLRDELEALPGVTVREVGGPAFKEQVVLLPDHAPVDDANRRLAEAGILGGLDLRADFPWLGNAMLVCTTEAHTIEDVSELVEQLRRVVGSRRQSHSGRPQDGAKAPASSPAGSSGVASASRMRAGAASTEDEGERS